MENPYKEVWLSEEDRLNNLKFLQHYKDAYERNKDKIKKTRLKNFKKKYAA